MINVGKHSGSSHSRLSCVYKTKCLLIDEDFVSFLIEMSILDSETGTSVSVI